MMSSSSSAPRMGSLIPRRRSNDDLSLPLHCEKLSQSPGPDDTTSCSSSSSLSISSHSSHSCSSSTRSTRRRRSHRRPSPTLWAKDTGDELSLPTKCPSLTANKSSSRRSKTSYIGAFLLGGLFFCGIWIGCYVMVTTYLEAHDQAVRDGVRQAEIVPLEKDLQRKVSHLEQDNRFMQHRLEGLEDERAVLLQQQASELHEHVQQLDKESTGYKQSIQKLSKYALHERFGDGPHHVEIQLAFDPAAGGDSNNEDNNKIILELAQADEMPHSVFWFLEQVTRGLYDGTSIHRSATHVVQGGPHTNFMTTPAAAEMETAAESSNNALFSRFQRSGFEQVLMQEYNEIWAHQHYTIGYAAGGPDFYFNMLDNARVHGPGRAGHAADPCFAKVISGFELVDKIHQSPVQPGAYHALQNNVAIVSMRLMEQKEPILLQLQQEQEQQRQAVAAQA